MTQTTIQGLQQLAETLQEQAGQIQPGIADGRIRVEAGEDEHEGEIRLTDGVVTEYYDDATAAEVAIREWVDNLTPIGSLEVIFDNGGGITVQCNQFVHSYDDPGHAAHDVRQLLAGDDPSDWDGNNPEHRIKYTDEHLRNGSYHVYDAADLRRECAETGEIRVSGFARAEFLATLADRPLGE